MSEVREFTKKPVTIEAVKAADCLYDAQHDFWALPKWIIAAYDKGDVIFVPHQVLIQTLEGRMTADEADWIIKGVKGELYPCKPDIFEMTYSPAKLDTGVAPETGITLIAAEQPTPSLERADLGAPQELPPLEFATNLKHEIQFPGMSALPYRVVFNGNSLMSICSDTDKVVVAYPPEIPEGRNTYFQAEERESKSMQFMVYAANRHYALTDALKERERQLLAALSREAEKDRLINDLRICLENRAAELSEAKAAHGKTLLTLNKAAFETIPKLEADIAQLQATIASQEAENGIQQRTIEVWEESYLKEHGNWGDCKFRLALEELQATINTADGVGIAQVARITLLEARLEESEKERDELLYHSRHGSPDDVEWTSPITVGHLRRQLETLDPNMAIGCAYFVKIGDRNEARTTGVSMSYERVDNLKNCIDSRNKNIPRGIIIWAHSTDAEAELQSLREREQLLEGLVKEYRQSHINSLRPCINSASCSTCKAADAILTPK